MYRAYATFPGEVVEKPFEEGVGFNGEIRRRAAAQALGWKARLTDHVEGGRAQLTLAIRDPSGHPVEGLRPVGQISRTVTLSGRQAVTFQETQPGVYAANVVAPSGLSELELKAKGPNGADFELEQSGRRLADGASGHRRAVRRLPRQDRAECARVARGDRGAAQPDDGPADRPLAGGGG
eukprot:gene13304-15375_t